MAAEAPGALYFMGPTSSLQEKTSCARKEKCWLLHNNIIVSYDINSKMHPNFREVKMVVKVGHARINELQ